MCGITGWIRNTENELTGEDKQHFESITRQLISGIESRGKDSTGVYVENSRGVSYEIRRCLSATELLDSKAYKKWSQQAFSDDPSLVLAHTRLATVGDVCNINAHPLKTTGDIVVGVHNGGLPNYTEVTSKNDLYKYFTGTTDSIRIFANIARNIEGITPDIEIKNKIAEAIKDFEGQAALAFTIKDRSSLWLFKDGNPCHIFYDKKLRTLFFSSYDYVIANVLKEHNLNPVKYMLDNEIIYEFLPSLFADKPFFSSPAVGARLKPTYYGGYFGGWANNNRNRGGISISYDRNVKTDGGWFNPNYDCVICHESLGSEYWACTDKSLKDVARFCNTCYNFAGDMLQYLDLDKDTRKIHIKAGTKYIGNISSKREVVRKKAKPKKDETDSCKIIKLDTKKIIKEFRNHSIGCECKTCKEAFKVAADSFTNKISLNNQIVTSEDI